MEPDAPRLSKSLPGGSPVASSAPGKTLSPPSHGAADFPIGPMAGEAKAPFHEVRPGHYFSALWLRGWLPRSGARPVVRGAARRGSSRRISVRLALPWTSRAAGFCLGLVGRFCETTALGERTAMTGVSGGGGRTTRLGLRATVGFVDFTPQPSADAPKDAMASIAHLRTCFALSSPRLSFAASAATSSSDRCCWSLWPLCGWS